jgi:hypothetical protein
MAFDKSVFAKLGAPTVILTFSTEDFTVDLLLAYDMNAAGLVKDKLNKSLFSQEDLTTLDPTEWVTVAWAGLCAHQPGITVQEVGTAMNPGNYQYVVEKCMAALTATLPNRPTTEPTAQPALAL